MAAKKMLHQLPLKKKTLGQLSVLDPALTDSNQAPSCFKALAKDLPNLLSEEEQGKLAAELTSLSVYRQVDVIRSEFEEGQRIDVNVWTEVFNLTTFEYSRYPVLKKLVHALLTVLSGPLIEWTFNVIDDIVEKDRTNLTFQNYESVAVVKTSLTSFKIKSLYILKASSRHQILQFSGASRGFFPELRYCVGRMDKTSTYF